MLSKRISKTAVCTVLIAQLLSAQPQKAQADGWGTFGKVAAVVAGAAAVGYVAYRGYENYQAREAAYDNALFSDNGNGGGGYYSGGGDDDYYTTSNDEADAEANRIYEKYLKVFSAHREADAAKISELHDNASSAMEAQAASSKEAWVCSAICGSDTEDRASKLSDDRDGRLKMYHLTGSVVSGEGKSPVDILKQMGDSCSQKGKDFFLMNDVVKRTKAA